MHICKSNISHLFGYCVIHQFDNVFIIACDLSFDVRKIFKCLTCIYLFQIIS